MSAKSDFDVERTGTILIPESLGGDYRLKNTQNIANTVIYAGLLVVFGLIGVVLLDNRRFENTVEARVDDLIKDGEHGSAQQYTQEDIADPPVSVRGYFQEVLAEGQPIIPRVRLHHRGKFRLGGAGAPWRSITPTQHFTNRPPGFVWDTTIDVLPVLPVRVIDLYKPSPRLR